MLHRRLSLSKLTWNPQKWGGWKTRSFKNIVILGFHLKLQGLDIIGPMVVNPLGYRDSKVQSQYLAGWRPSFWQQSQARNTGRWTPEDWPSTGHIIFPIFSWPSSGGSSHVWKCIQRSQLANLMIFFTIITIVCGGFIAHFQSTPNYQLVNCIILYIYPSISIT